MIKEDNNSVNYVLGKTQFDIGVEKDMNKAIEYFQKAADLGYTYALNNLGFCYLNGYGVEKDLKKGFEYIEKAADGGLNVSQFNCGTSYEHGANGIEKDIISKQPKVDIKKLVFT